MKTSSTFKNIRTQGIKALGCIIVLAAMASIAAQWSSDPAVNTIIAGTGNDRASPKVAYDRVDSCWYISNFASVPEPNNFEVWLQRLDAGGNRLWGNDGLAVSRHPFSSWYSDYSLVCDSAGCAVLAFADLRAGTGYSNICLYKMSRSGAYAWDSAGLVVTAGSANNLAPILAVTPGNKLLCAWNIAYDNNKSAIGIQRFTADGQACWQAPTLVTGADTLSLKPHLLTLPDEQFILVWNQGSMQNSSIYAQRFDSLGKPVWPNPVAICNLGIIRAGTKIQVATAANGFYTSWNDDRINSINTYVMYTGYDGTSTWPANGVLASIDTNNCQIVGALTLLPASHEPVVLWMNTDPKQNYEGMSCQKFSASGQRQWGDSGIVYVPMTTVIDTSLSDVQALPGPDNTVGIVYQKRYTTKDLIDSTVVAQGDLMAFRLTSAGAYSWPQHMVPVSTSKYEKSALAVAATPSLDRYLAVWQDNRDAGPSATAGKIFGQNILISSKNPTSIKSNCLNKARFERIHIRTDANNMVAFSYDHVFEKSKPVYLSIYTASGKEIKRFISTVPGKFIWDAKSRPSGIYLVRLKSGGKVISQQFWLQH